MGLSTFDIPTHFLNPGMKATFLSWLAAIPAPTSSKRRLLSTWSQATRVKLTREDYARVFPSTTG